LLIFWSARLVFLANTKTGSTSVESALAPLAHVALQRPHELMHLSARGYRDSIAPLLERLGGGRFRTVALMRDPVDWLGSWFRTRCRDDIAPAERVPGDTDFSRFVEAYLSGVPPAWARLVSQAEFLCGEDGAVLADRIFRYERIGAFLHHLEDTFGCEITLPRLNVSPPRGLGLRDDLRRALLDRFAPDYAIYDSLG
jgi:hypothetical protein